MTEPEDWFRYAAPDPVGLRQVRSSVVPTVRDTAPWWKSGSAVLDRMERWSGAGLALSVLVSLVVWAVHATIDWWFG